MKYYNIILLLSIILGASCERQESNSEKAIEYEPREMVEVYMDIKDALIESNAVQVKKYGFEYKQILDSAFRDDIDETMLIVVNNLANSNDLQAQRIYFEQVSELLFAKILRTGNTERTLYKQFCPMAFNDEGAFWLSYESDILNPYFGDEMLRCGFVQDTIKNL